ncbi:hypothetical protein HCU40_13805 [Pseudanabaena biceps]|nr:hypothetical protein [Pseudanabaena biceps]
MQRLLDKAKTQERVAARSAATLSWVYSNRNKFSLRRRIRKSKMNGDRRFVNETWEHRELRLWRLSCYVSD